MPVEPPRDGSRAGDAPRAESRMSAQSRITVRVDAIHQETDDIKRFHLVSTGADALPAWTPGSHIDVNIPGGIVRQYSLCGPLDAPDQYVIAVKREADSRGGSEAMHGRLSVGDILEIGAPRNNFPLDEAALHSVLLAGGIGITPILSMAERLSALGRSFELHYFSRAPSQTAFRDRLQQAGHAMHLHYSLAPDGVRACLRKLLWERPEGAQLYLCGPKPFMDTVQTVAAATWPPDAVNLEYFGSDSAALSGAKGSFTVELKRSGVTCAVRADQTIVEALAGAGIDVDYSCKQGVCGTCLTGVLEGVPDHRDMFLSPEERAAKDRICLCVSRAKTDVLVLDL